MVSSNATLTFIWIKSWATIM